MSISYSVDLKAPGRPYPHYWEFCVGSCHAATILREDVREHIRRAHRECGFRYLRFHGLFDGDTGVHLSQGEQKPQGCAGSNDQKGQGGGR